MNVIVKACTKALCVSLLSVAVLVGQASAETKTKTFSVISNGEKVGSLKAEIKGGVTELDYIVRNNGRGPKWTERIVTNKNGDLLEWSVQGESTFGGAVDEEYVWKDGRAKWRSQADSGDVEAVKPGVYIANDTSPWSNGVYAKVFLKTKRDELAVLPGGTMRLKRIGSDQLKAGKNTIPVDIYAISGVDLTPSFFMLDKQGDLAATVPGGSATESVTIREGFESEAPRLEALSNKLTRDMAEELQSKLAHKFDGPIHYQNVRILDTEKGVTSGLARVTVFHGKIAAIDYDDPVAKPREGEVVIDGEGGVLVPGLHDMHAHDTMWSGLFYIAAGVTATRDQGNDPEMIIKLSEDYDAGVLAGPRIVRNGFIEGRSNYSARVAFIADTLEQGLDDVRWYADHGFFQIKLYNSINPEWVKPMAAEAHRLGMGVTGHVPAFMSPDDAILAGYDDIAHINQLELGWLLKEGEDTRTPLRLTGLARGAHLSLDDPKVKRTVALMKEHGVALDTTTVILERLMLSRAGEIAEGDAAYLSHAPIGYQRYRKRTFVPLDAPGADDEYQLGFKKLVEVMGLLYGNGIQMLPGTDDATGFTVHRELELYAEAGIPNAEVMRLATLAAEKYLKRDQMLGSIKTGKYADFFLVPNDPLEDISNVRGAKLVSRGDSIYFPSEIYEALAFKPFSQPPHLEQH
ncbi:MAG: amidohydrolase family protein [Amphiplicatus sp.]|nr:amidohydrolase family protein [Amphiplicatus sp.]MCB9956660.1 amidohydrolase family protein [Caulobacterales bacterium]